MPQDTIIDSVTDEIVPAPNSALVQWGEARRVIEKARTVDELKDIRDKAEAIRMYAKQAGETLEVQNDVAEIKLRAERRAGELLSEMAENGERAGKEHGAEIRDHHVEGRDMIDTPPTLSDMGLSRDQSSQWQRAATIPEQVFEQHIADTKSSREELTSTGIQNLAKGVRNSKAVTTSDSNEWYTPKEYLEAVRNVIGNVTLDPASSEMANETVCADEYFTKSDNGLEQEWYGNVFLNPPYGGMSGPFVEKLMAEYQSGNVTQFIVLVNANSTETKWFAPLWDFLLCFTDHRINFISPTGEKNGSTHGSVFVYGGDNGEQFVSAFNKVGYLAKRIG